ncbi:MAG: DUF2786 domain-containing protein [Myxococcales bacterium]|nr:DUF2786 domain-containing protein [Myxococcales bacterium]
MPDPRQVATIEEGEALTEAAIAGFFAGYYVEGARVTREPHPAVALPAGCWAIVLPDAPRTRLVLQRVLPASELARVGVVGGALVLVQPAGRLRVKGGAARRLLRAIDDARPRQPNGLPAPWVVPAAPSAPLGRPADEADVVVEPAPADEGDALIPALRADFERLRRHLGLPALPLAIRQGTTFKHGFVTGRLHLRGGQPTGVVLTLCPASDHAEAAATLAHELAHAVTPGTGHGRAFKEALVALARFGWGAAPFAAAQAADPYPVLDAWITAGIRAALAGHPAPAPVDADEAQVAVVVRRVQKLRALAQDQPGTPEGRAAAARANDLIVTHGLGACHVALPADLGDALCDRWIGTGKRQPWRARVGFAVAAFCDVFALEHRSEGGMHLFGRYADVVAAEHLYGVATERIERRCAAHLAAQRARGLAGGALTRERTSFLHSAAHGFEASLRRARPAPDPEPARRFAQAEHEKRGLRWGTGRGVGYTHSQAGFEAGSAIPVAKAVGGRPPRGLLGG